MSRTTLRLGTRILACALGLAVLAGITACTHAPGAEVVVSAALPRTLHIAPAGTGTVLAGVDHAVLLERRATVRTVNVVDGEWVQRGQLLLQVVTIGQSAAVATATNQLWLDHNRLAGVRARDGAFAATTLALLNQIDRDRQYLSDLKNSPTSITAPVTGRVSGLSVRAGTAADRTKVILHVVDDSTVQVVVPVAANYRMQLAVHQQAVLSLPSQPGASFTATVVGIGPTAESDSGGDETVPVTVTASNATRAITLGSSVYVRMPMVRRASVAVDSVAVLGMQQQPFVFIVDHGRVRQHAVKVGASDGSWTELFSGVGAGQEVVISGGQRLVDGAQIHVSHVGAP
jgi:membrane fusion protein (multidrug efflux system)